MFNEIGETDYIRDVKRYTKELENSPTRNPQQKKQRDSKQVRSKFWTCDVDSSGYLISVGKPNVIGIHSDDKSIYYQRKEVKEPNHNGRIKHIRVMRHGKHSRKGMRAQEAWWNEAYEEIDIGYDMQHEIDEVNDMLK